MQNTIPMLPSAPVVGNIIEFARDRTSFLRRGYNLYGSIFGFKLAKQTIITLVDPEYQQWFFTETDKTLRMDKPYEQLAAILGKVAFLASKEDYQNQHPILYQPFKPEKMLTYVKVMQREVQRWIDSLPMQGEFNLTAELNHLVQEVAGNAILGSETHQQLGREFWDLYAELGKSLTLVIPPNWITPQSIRRERTKAKMRQLLQPIIIERRRNPDKYDDFLQDFVVTHLRNGEVADDELVIGLLRALMFASHETTAGQSAWTIIELLRHPQYRTLVSQEVDVLPSNIQFDARSLRQLQYTYWAIREIERLHPSADVLMRMADRDIHIGTYDIPAGTFLLVAANVSHRLPHLFKNPDDFDPLRFAPDRAEDKQHGYSMIGFGGGKHKCAGMNFANNEMIVITALMLQQLDMELVTINPKIVYDQGASRPDTTIVRYRKRQQQVALGQKQVEADA